MLTVQRGVEEAWRSELSTERFMARLDVVPARRWLGPGEGERGNSLGRSRSYGCGQFDEGGAGGLNCPE